jgi:hypothetical protein
MVYAGMLYFFQMFLCLRCHHGLAHMMVRGLPVVGKILLSPNPPPVPPTLAEAIATLVNATADNTCFLREMAGNQFQLHGGRAPPQGPRETTYLEVSKT